MTNFQLSESLVKLLSMYLIKLYKDRSLEAIPSSF